MRKPHRYARKLRQEMPPAERLLWSSIRKKQLGGFRFRRQHTVGPYIVDFICVEIKLVVELDGGQHTETVERDRVRDAFLAEQGFSVLRFWNDEVFDRLDDVLQTIRSQAEDLAREPKA